MSNGSDVGKTDDLHPPIRLAGEEFRASKEFVAGTHRAMDPAKTLERIRPHLSKAGVTRVADITGLDTVGIPVAISVRPGSGTLAVDSGKGATLIAAATSASMEAIERFVGEEDHVCDAVGTINELGDRLSVAPDRFPVLSHATIRRDKEFSWSEMWDLNTGVSTLVPESLVLMPHPVPGLLSLPWASSSNGLASGNHVAEALCAGLYEVIERDATSCWMVALTKGAQRLRVDLNTLKGEIIGGLCEQIWASDSNVAIYWCPTEMGVPVFVADVWSNRGGVGTYRGYGCHLDPEIAMIRAVTEAVQARTVFVAGARDDLMRGGFEALRRSDVLSSDEIVANSKLVTVDDIPDRATGTFHGDVALLLDGLRMAGFDSVLARELPLGREFEVSVVRVVVPGLEPYRFRWVAITDRAQNFIVPAVGS